MAQEQKANVAQSTLSSGISAGAATLTVASATLFPTVPQFRLKINDEILLATGVTGAVFDIDRGIEGSTAAVHSGGDTVTLVETKAGQERFMRDWASPLALVRPPMQLLDSTGATLNAASFSNVNFTNATKTDQTGGAILLEHETQSAANDFALIVKSAPTAPWTLRVGFIPNLLNETGDFPSAGPVVHENTSGEFYAFRYLVSDDGVWIDIQKYASPTSSATAFLSFQDWSPPGIVWCEIEDNNTNLIFKVSSDGVNYITIGQEARTTFLTPDEIGFAINNFGNGAIKAHATIVAWEESA